MISNKLEPGFNLSLNGQSYSGWTSMSVSRSIERMSGEFSLSLTKIGDSVQSSIGVFAGQPCDVEIEGQVVLRGYVDSVSHSYDKSALSISVNGRDKCGDLIDCAASIDGPFEFLNVKLETILNAALKPFNIPLTIESGIETGAVFKRLAIQPGESVYELIDRVCRYRSLLPISDGIGGLIITKIGSVKSLGNITQGINVLKGEMNVDWKDRYSLYVVKGQGEALSQSSPDELAQGEGRAIDPYITRFRPTLITGENQGFDLSLIERANWEAQFARARSTSANYTVQGWYADEISKSLWLPNTMVYVDDPVLSIKREMLITSVVFERGLDGTFTKLVLSLPEAFMIPAEKEGNDEIGDL